MECQAIAVTGTHARELLQLSVAQWKQPEKSSPATPPKASASNGHNGDELSVNARAITRSTTTVLAAVMACMAFVVSRVSPGSVRMGSRRPSGPRVGLMDAGSESSRAALFICSTASAVEAAGSDTVGGSAKFAIGVSPRRRPGAWRKPNAGGAYAALYAARASIFPGERGDLARSFSSATSHLLWRDIL